ASTSGTGPAIEAQGGRAQLFLQPAATAGPPTTNGHFIGEVFVDSAGVHWLCTATGTPGTWVRALTTGTNNVGAAAIAIQASGAGVPLRLTSTGTGTPFFCTINNASSGAPSIKGYTSGTGSAVIAQIANAPNVHPALY